MPPLENILVIENNKKYIETAKEFFSRENIKVDFVENYEDALKIMKNYNALMIDLFIPENKKERMGKIGKKFMEEFKNKLIEFSQVYKLINEMKPLNLFKLMKKAKNNEELKSLIKEQPMLLLHKKTREKYFKGNYSLQFLEDEEKKNHAPLGILIAKKAEEMEIPYIYVSDVGHVSGHGLLGPGIWAVYYSDIMNYNKFEKIFIDTKYERKDSLEFWKNAYEILKKIAEN